MNIQKQKYFERKTKVLECLDEAGKFFENNGFDKEKESVQAQYDNVKNEDFTIAVVGEFSSGKSTFLNALMGEKLLPSFSRETTATVNFLRHKEKSENSEEGCVYYNDGTVKKLEKADNKTIERYVCTNSDEDVAANISHLDLYLSNKFLENNVTLVDTPGLNGIREGHKEITETQIEKSSASIFLFNANQPGSKTDFDALQMLRKRVKSIFLVLNRIDLIKTDENETPEDIIKILKDKYKADYPEEKTIPEFFPISAYKALVARSSQNLSYHDRKDFTDEEKKKYEKESGMIEFEEKLWKFLTEGEKGKAVLINPIVQLLSTLDNVHNFLLEQKSVLESNCDTDELEQRIKDYKEKSESIQKSINSKTSDITRKLRDAEKEFTEEIESEAIQFKNVYIKEINNFSSLDEIDPEVINKKMSIRFSSILNSAYINYGYKIEEILALENLAITDELAEMISDKQKYNIKKVDILTTFDTGIEQFEKQVEDMNLEIADLIAQTEKLENDVIKARKLKREKERLEREMESVKEAQEWYRQNALAALPSVRAKTTEIVNYIDRDGVLGKVKEFFVGKEKHISTTIEYDTTERDEYQKQIDRNMNEYKNEINELRNKASQYDTEDSEAAQLRLKRKEAQIEQLRNEKQEFEKRKIKELREKSIAQLKKQKNEIECIIEENVSELLTQSREVFKKTRKNQAEALKSLISAPLIEQIEHLTKQTEILLEKSKSSEKDRNENLGKINIQIDKVKELLVKTLDINNELKEIETEYINEESL